MSGRPGDEAEPTVLDESSDPFLDMLAGLLRVLLMLVRPVLYVLIPPLYLYRGSGPPTDRIWRWRRVYAGFALGTIVLSIPSILHGTFSSLLIAPVFHLFVGIVCIEVLLIVVPGVTVPASAQPPEFVMTVAVAAFVAAVALSITSTWHTSRETEVDTSPVSLDSRPGEYIIPMTRVWDSGGKYD